MKVFKVIQAGLPVAKALGNFLLFEGFSIISCRSICKGSLRKQSLAVKFLVLFSKQIRLCCSSFCMPYESIQGDSSRPACGKGPGKLYVILRFFYYFMQKHL